MQAALRLVAVDPYDVVRAARRDGRLSASARLLLHEIYEAQLETGFAHLTDEEYAALLGATARSVRHWMTELDRAGYVHREGRGTARTLRIVTDAAAVPATENRQDLAGSRIGKDFPSSPENRQELAGSIGKNLPIPSENEHLHLIETPLRGERGRARAREGAPPENARRAASPPLKAQPPEGRLGDRSEGENGSAPDASPAAPQHPAVRAYAEAIGRLPDLYWGERIAAKVGEEPERVEAWQDVCVVWATSTRSDGGRYNTSNVPRMLEAFDEALAPKPPPGASRFGEDAVDHDALSRFRDFTAEAQRRR